jgi:hypothetical protein
MGTKTKAPWPDLTQGRVVGGVVGSDNSPDLEYHIFIKNTFVVKHYLIFLTIPFLISINPFIESVPLRHKT